MYLASIGHQKQIYIPKNSILDILDILYGK